MKTGVLFVHGIGPFSTATLKQQVAPFMKRFPDDEISWDVFNWDILSPDPLVDLPRVAYAASRCMHMQSSKRIPTGGIRGVVYKCHNQLCWSSQLLATILPLMVLLAPVTGTLVRVTAVLLFAVALLSIFSGVFSLAEIWTPIRRAGIAVVWPIVHFLGAPLFVLLSRRVSILLVCLLFGPLMCLIAISAVFDPNDIARLQFLGARTPEKIIATNGLLLVLLVTYGLLLFAGKNWGYSAPVKLTADVVRYIGDSSHRKILFDALAAQIQSTVKSCDRLVIVAHSLGTAIANDVLTQRGFTLAEGKHVILISMGSPIRRYLFRFFYGIFSSPAEIAGCIRTKTASFTWLNVFRPYDFVGTSLDPKGDAGILELSTHQYRKIGMAAHANYFTDEVVVGLIAEGLSTARPLQNNAQDREFYSLRDIVIDGNGIGRLVKSLSERARVVATLVLCVGTAWIGQMAFAGGLLKGNYYRNKQIESARLRKSGAKSTAMIQCGGDPRFYIRRWGTDPPSGPTRMGDLVKCTISFLRGAPDQVRWFPRQQLDRFFWLQTGFCCLPHDWGGQELSDITVWYNPSKPEELTFDGDPDLTPPNPGSFFQDAALAITVPLSFVLMLGGVLHLFVVPWLETALGSQ